MKLYAIGMIRKMKYLLLLIVMVTLSCKKNTEFKNLKNNLLFKDDEGNIYLKRKIAILDENDFSNKKYDGYFDLAFYKDSIFKLNKLIDVKSFSQINKTDTFEDKRYIYVFIDKPATFPNIEVFAK